MKTVLFVRLRRVPPRLGGSLVFLGGAVNVFDGTLVFFGGVDLSLVEL